MSILRKSDLTPHPIEQFKLWYAEAESCGTMPLYMACCLSTVDEQGRPAGRMVLLKDVDAEGFVFYTNMNSPKGDHIRQQSYVELTFYWVEQRRQIRARGTCTAVSEAEADAYFASRDRVSQIGAWASRQSSPLNSREALEKRVERFQKQFEGRDVPRPEWWSGQRVRPERVEFWQEQPYRLHDRFAYNLLPDGSWHIERLYP